MNRRRTTAAVVLAAFAALTSAASAHVPGRPATISGDLNWASNDEKESS